MVEVDRRPPKKTPIKMAGAAASAVAKKADRAPEAKRPAATHEGEEREGGSNHSGTSGDGDDVRETSC